MNTIESLSKDVQYAQSKIEELNAYMITDDFEENKDSVYPDIINQYTSLLRLKDSLERRISILTAAAKQD